jgi:hypothetical protein
MPLAPSVLASLPDVLHVAKTGRMVRRDEVESLTDDERALLWYDRSYTTPDGVDHVAPEWPFVVDTIHFG